MAAILGNTPKNQIDALPIMTVVAAAAADDITIVGGTIAKFWSPTTLGMAGIVPTTDAAGHVFLVTPFLDMTGCTNGALLLTRTDTANSLAGAIYNPLVLCQYRITHVGAMPTSFASGGSINLPQAGINLIAPNPIAFVATIAAPTTQRGLATWGPSAIVASANQVGMTIGADVRIFVSFSTNAQPVTQTFSVSIWGAS